jgi:hypothetical protein
MVLRLSATTVKHFFQYRCDRQARYNLMASREREHSFVGQEHATCDKWAEAGDDFERQVVNALASTESVLAPMSPAKFLSSKATVEFLTRKMMETYAAQIPLHLTDSASFLQSRGGPSGVEFSVARPDLVRVEQHEGGIRLRKDRPGSLDVWRCFERWRS